MVSIFTYRDERKLYALVGSVIVAASVALVQLQAARSGRTSPLSDAVTSGSAYVEFALGAIASTLRSGTDAVMHLPALAGENARLTVQDTHLRHENARLEEVLARVPIERALAEAQIRYPGGIPATVVGFDPEDAIHTITIDRGSTEHVAIDDAVVAPDGAVGRIIEVTPLASKVLLLSDVTSKIPAVVQRGRWWGIATGSQTRVVVRYISQDAHLRIGDMIVTGEGRSFHAGIPIGRIANVPATAAGALDQTAVVEPAVDLGRLTRVLVVPK